MDVLHLKWPYDVLNTCVVHLDPPSQMLNLGHDVDVPVNVPRRTGCLIISSVFYQELVAILQGLFVISNDFR